MLPEDELVKRILTEQARLGEERRLRQLRYDAFKVKICPDCGHSPTVYVDVDGFNYRNYRCNSCNYQEEFYVYLDGQAR